MLTFEFISKGPNGLIEKIVKFQEIELTGFYNLSYGDKENEVEINDSAISNNGDTDRILVTVALSAFHFFSKYNNALIFVMGSTESRTRLFQIGISKHLPLIEADFVLFGFIDGRWEEYSKNRSYEAFLIKRK